jgi:tripartite-type tricarboxylate transporter receptor subunit TctC
LGQPPIFVYKTGAQGCIGYSLLPSPSPMDVLYSSIPGHDSLIPLLACREWIIPWMTLFLSVAWQGSFSIVVMTDPPFKNLKDIVEEAKKPPDKLSYYTNVAY